MTGRSYSIRGVSSSYNFNVICLAVQISKLNVCVYKHIFLDKNKVNYIILKSDHLMSRHFSLNIYIRTDLFLRFEK